MCLLFSANNLYTSTRRHLSTSRSLCIRVVYSIVLVISSLIVCTAHLASLFDVPDTLLNSSLKSCVAYVSICLVVDSSCTDTSVIRLRSSLATIVGCAHFKRYSFVKYVSFNAARVTMSVALIVSVYATLRFVSTVVATLYLVDSDSLIWVV